MVGTLMHRTWRAGDPIGGGALCFPSAYIRSEYADRCRDEIIEGMARQVVGLATLAQRRAFIGRCPEGLRDTLKARIKQMWRAKQGE